MMDFESKPPVQQATEELESKLDELMAPIYFQELLQMAGNVCLTKPLKNVELSPLSEEAAVVSSLGTRAIKSAVELQQEVSIMYIHGEDDKVYENEEDRPIAIDSPLRIPKNYSTAIDRTIIKKAEAFGSQLIDESFKVLGKDAYRKAALFQQATTKQEQMAVIQWLDTRLSKINDTVKDIDGNIKSRDDSETMIDGQPYFYHPARLSPKLIGEYPNNHLSPTCLGISIIATSFFKRANAEVLHANVSNRGIETDQEDFLMFIDTLSDQLDDRFDIELPEAIQSSLNNVYNQTFTNLLKNTAHHAATYVRLLEGGWAQVDSNYYSSVEIKDKRAVERLDLSFSSLTELSEVAPGLEIKQMFLDGVSLGRLGKYIIELTDADVTNRIKITAAKEIESYDIESLGQRIFDASIKPFFYDENEKDSRLLKLKQYFTALEFVDADGSVMGIIEKSYQSMFEKYVLWGESPEEVMKRMAIDESYRENRLTDISNLPFIVMVGAISLCVNNISGEGRSHSIVEIGLPETRIGLAVLSDFAAYTDSPLPPSFWTSHWPGSISVLENVTGASKSNQEDTLLANNLVHMKEHILTSYRYQGIIHKFTDVRNQP